jgi:hypothetical protein
MIRFRGKLNPDPSCERTLKGILSFKRFSDAEETLRKLELLRRQFLRCRDERGLEDCRQAGLLGRRRAELVSRNRRVSTERRRQKKEIAFWFQVWLETPDIFEDWLAMRKRTEEFQALQRSEMLEPVARRSQSYDHGR